MRRSPRATRTDTVLPSATLFRAVANVLAGALEREQRERSALVRALHDPLTGLPTRPLFTDRLTHALTRAQRHRSEEHTSVLQSLMRNSYAVFCLTKQTSLMHKPNYDIHETHTTMHRKPNRY